MPDFRERGLPHILRSGSVLEQDFATKDDLQRHPYYQFLAKYGFRWSAMFGFNSGEDLLCFVLQRQIGNGHFDRDEELMLRRICKIAPNVDPAFHSKQRIEIVDELLFSESIASRPTTPPMWTRDSFYYPIA